MHFLNLNNVLSCGFQSAGEKSLKRYFFFKKASKMWWDWSLSRSSSRNVVMSRRKSEKLWETKFITPIRRLRLIDDCSELLGLMVRFSCDSEYFKVHWEWKAPWEGLSVWRGLGGVVDLFWAGINQRKLPRFSSCCLPVTCSCFWKIQEGEQEINLFKNSVVFFPQVSFSCVKLVLSGKNLLEEK